MFVTSPLGAFITPKGPSTSKLPAHCRLAPGDGWGVALITISIAMEPGRSLRTTCESPRKICEDAIDPAAMTQMGSRKTQPLFIVFVRNF